MATTIGVFLPPLNYQVTGLLENHFPEVHMASDCDCGPPPEFHLAPPPDPSAFWPIENFDDENWSEFVENCSADSEHFGGGLCSSGGFTDRWRPNDKIGYPGSGVLPEIVPDGSMTSMLVKYSLLALALLTAVLMVLAAAFALRRCAEKRNCKSGVFGGRSASSSDGTAATGAEDMESPRGRVGDQGHWTYTHWNNAPALAVQQQQQHEMKVQSAASLGVLMYGHSPQLVHANGQFVKAQPPGAMFPSSTQPRLASLQSSGGTMPFPITHQTAARHALHRGSSGHMPNQFVDESALYSRATPDPPVVYEEIGTTGIRHPGAMSTRRLPPPTERPPPPPPPLRSQQVHRSTDMSQSECSECSCASCDRDAPIGNQSASTGGSVDHELDQIQVTPSPTRRAATHQHRDGQSETQPNVSTNSDSPGTQPSLNSYPGLPAEGRESGYGTQHRRNKEQVSHSHTSPQIVDASHRSSRRNRSKPHANTAISSAPRSRSSHLRQNIWIQNDHPSRPGSNLALASNGDRPPRPMTKTHSMTYV